MFNIFKKEPEPIIQETDYLTTIYAASAAAFFSFIAGYRIGRNKNSRIIHTFQKIFNNLVENAIDDTPKNGAYTAEEYNHEADNI